MCWQHGLSLAGVVGGAESPAWNAWSRISPSACSNTFPPTQCSSQVVHKFTSGAEHILMCWLKPFLQYKVSSSFIFSLNLTHSTNLVVYAWWRKAEYWIEAVWRGQTLFVFQVDKYLLGARPHFGTASLWTEISLFPFLSFFFFLN